MNADRTATAGRRAIIVGAASGVGRALAHELAAADYALALADVQIAPLRRWCEESQGAHRAFHLDLRAVDSIQETLQSEVAALGGLDLFVVAAAVLNRNPRFDLAPELETCDVNVSGFVAATHWAFSHFIQQGHGHLAAVSSVICHKGVPHAPAYAASKAFVSRYLEGLRLKTVQLRRKVYVTELRPGFVATPMVEDYEHKFWCVSPSRAAALMATAIRKRKRVAYIDERWRVVPWALRLFPDALFVRYLPS